MKKTLFTILSMAFLATAASAQTKKEEKKAEVKKENCHQEGKSCCSPTSKAKAISKAKTKTIPQPKG